MKNSNLNRGLIDQIDPKNIINQDKILLIELITQKIRDLVRSAINVINMDILPINALQKLQRRKLMKLKIKSI